MVCKQISKRFVQPPEWWAPPTAEKSPPSLRKPDVKCFEDKTTGNSRYCVRCQEEEDEEERLKQEERDREAAKKKDERATKNFMRDRMKRMASRNKNKPAAKKIKK